MKAKLAAVERPRVSARDPATDAAALLKLLGPRARGAWQSTTPPDRYPGDGFTIAVEHLAKHLTGDGALGVFASANGLTGYWFGVDVDARWSDRGPCLAAALRRRKLDEAAVFTEGGGSRPKGSGKVVVFFANALPLRDLRKLALDVVADAMRDPSFGYVERPEHVEVWPKPKRDDGGRLRIGGRHQTRGLRVERLFNADGGDLDLRDVRPSRIHAVGGADPKPIHKAGAHRFVRKWRDEGLPESILTAGHVRITQAVQRLAFEAWRLHGEAGAALLHGWLADISKATPAIATGAWSSPKTGDKRNPLGWDYSGKGAWARAVRDRGGKSATLLPSPPWGGSNVAPKVAAAPREAPDVVAVVVALLAQYVEAKGLHPGAFEVSYRQIAGWLGERDVKKVWRLVQRAVKRGKLRIVHRGVPGEKGLKTIYGLVESRETESKARARADVALARREQKMIAHAQAKWAAAKAAPEGDPVKRRAKARALAREVVREPAPAPVVAKPSPSSPGTLTREQEALLAYARSRLSEPRRGAT